MLWWLETQETLVIVLIVFAFAISWPRSSWLTWLSCHGALWPVRSHVTSPAT
jgi:hypothetical protein